MGGKRLKVPLLIAAAWLLAGSAPAVAGGDAIPGPSPGPAQDTPQAADAADASAASPATPAVSGLTAATMVSPSALAGAGPAAVGADYRIGPSDQLDVNVYDIPDLSRSVQVDAGGKIMLPLVGEVDAQGQTAQQLSGAIATDLKQRYVKNPLVTVVVKDAASARVTVDGAVVAPGTYRLAGPTTLLQAVALARGPNPKTADERHVALFRLVNGRRQGAVYNLNAIRTGAAPDPEVYGRDIVVVAPSRGKALWNHFVQIAPALGMLAYF